MKYVLRLYVAGRSAMAMRAMENLRRLSEEELSGRADIEIIDVLKEPERAERAKVVATPTLIKEHPAPTRKIIGDLSDRAVMLASLDLLPSSHSA